MANAPGKLKEKVVTILERHIDDSARVSCDVLLPVIAHPEMEPRQIDVLIKTGTPARPTITIVEVQDRKSKPSRGEFDGWLEKMKEVGAQHLMCVTRVGYPKTIVTKATKIGPSVRLFTLQQLERAEDHVLPPTIMSSNLDVVTYERLLGIKIIPAHPFEPHPAIDPNNLPDPHFKMFLPAGRREFVSATEVTDWHLFAHPKNVRELPHTGEVIKLKYGYDCDPKKPWHFIAKVGSVPIQRFEVLIQLSVLSHPTTWKHNYYEQLGKGEVGWILKGTTTYDGKDTVVYLPLRKIADGLYSAGRPTAMSPSADTFIGFGDVGYKADDFAHLSNLKEQE